MFIVLLVGAGLMLNSLWRFSVRAIAPMKSRRIVTGPCA